MRCSVPAFVVSVVGVPVGVGVAAFALAGCRKHIAPSGHPTADYFAEHRLDLETVRAMLVADHGLVTSVGKGPFGGIHDAAGAKGSCGAELRGNGFPWKCTGDVVVNDLGAVEAFLGLPKGRLRAYERALPAHAVSGGEPCAPAGSFVFWLEDVDASPCTGIDNIVWSPVPPVTKTDGTCRRTVATEYVPLGDGFYEDACVVRRSKP